MEILAYIALFSALNFLFAAIGADIANKKGRCGWCYFLAAWLITPLITIIIAIAVDDKNKNTDQAKIERGELKECPACKEAIKPNAIKCKHCGESIEAETNTNPAKHEPNML